MAPPKATWTPEQQQLFNAIQSFPLDKPGVRFPFSARLALENNWTLHFALRAIDEYRRFVFLAMTAGHPVTPSEEIDEVWHLHLVYTRSYWEEFCGKILPRPLHHNPTEGGSDEDNKFEDWYSKTLDSYRKTFDEDPPPDIWPPVEIRSRTPIKSKIIRSHYWLIKRPRTKKNK